MKYLFIIFFLLGSLLNATDINQSSTIKKDNNITQKHLKEQMELEKKYAKEKTFYEGKDYNLSNKKINENELDNVPLIEPEDDFDITDV